MKTWHALLTVTALGGGAELIDDARQFDRTDPATLCSVGTLRHNPEGYHYPLDDVIRFVKDSELIVRAVAERAGPLDRPLPDVLYGNDQAIYFRVVEVLHGHPAADTLVLAGQLVDRDDFNQGPVPYRIVRSSGLRGDCFAREYRAGGEYLLLLQRRAEGFTVHWGALAPLNEQIRGADDAWVTWVRQQLAPRPPRPRPASHPGAVSLYQRTER